MNKSSPSRLEIQEMAIVFLRKGKLTLGEMYGLFEAYYRTSHTSRSSEYFAGRIINGLSALEKKGVILESRADNPHNPTYVINPMWEILDKARTEAGIKS